MCAGNEPIQWLHHRQQVGKALCELAQGDSQASSKAPRRCYEDWAVPWPTNPLWCCKTACVEKAPKSKHQNFRAVKCLYSVPMNSHARNVSARAMSPNR